MLNRNQRDLCYFQAFKDFKIHNIGEDIFHCLWKRNLRKSGRSYKASPWRRNAPSYQICHSITSSVASFCTTSNCWSLWNLDQFLVTMVVLENITLQELYSHLTKQLKKVSLVIGYRQANRKRMRMIIRLEEIITIKFWYFYAI